MSEHYDPDLKMTFLCENSRGYITLVGNLTTYNSQTLSQDFENFISQHKLDEVFIHCESLNYVSSTGVGALSYIYKTCYKKEIKLYFVGVVPSVMRVFSLLGITSMFNFIDKRI